MASFSLYIPLLTNVEGGYQALPQDSGNYNSLNQLVGTNHGISAPVYEKYIGHPPTAQEMKTMSLDTALKIYRAWYWDKINASRILNQSIANVIVDHAVNAGVAAAGKLVQNTINKTFGFKLVVDGVIGNNTINAINSIADQKKLHDALINARKEFYQGIGGVFLTGWLYRLTKFVYDEKKKYLA